MNVLPWPWQVIDNNTLLLWQVFFSMLSIKQSILDIFKQSWYSNINNSSRLFHYSLHKQEFKIETYLICNIDKKYQSVLSKFRLYSNNLSIETGRYTNVERKDRLCIQCTMSMTEDDYHVLLVCPKYRHLRQKLFTPYFCKWPSLQKFTTLMSSSIGDILITNSDSSNWYLTKY